MELKHDLNGDFGRCAMAGPEPQNRKVPRYGSENAVSRANGAAPAADSGFRLPRREGPCPESPLCAPQAGLTPAMVRALEQKLHALVADPSLDSLHRLHREGLEVLEALRLLRKYGALEDQGIGLSDKVGYR